MIISFGYLAVELQTHIDNLKFPCSIISSKSHITAGGSTINQAISSARTGAKVSVIGMIGDDLFGKTIVDSLRHEGIQSSGIVKKDNYSTGIINTIINKNNQKAQILLKGANEQISSDLISNNSLNERILLLLQDETPDNINLDILQRAQDKGAISIICFKNAVNHDIANHADIAITNTEIYKVRTQKYYNIKPNNINAFTGTFAACIQAGMKIDLAIKYGTAAASITDKNNFPYLDDIKSKLKT